MGISRNLIWKTCALHHVVNLPSCKSSVLLTLPAITTFSFLSIDFPLLNLDLSLQSSMHHPHESLIHYTYKFLLLRRSLTKEGLPRKICDLSRTFSSFYVNAYPHPLFPATCYVTECISWTHFTFVIKQTTLPVKEISKSLQQMGYDVMPSDDAGRFVCNYVYYHSLRFAEKHGIRSLFVHFPLFSAIDEEVQMQFVASLLEVLASLKLQ